MLLPFWVLALSYAPTPDYTVHPNYAGTLEFDDGYTLEHSRDEEMSATNVFQVLYKGEVIIEMKWGDNELDDILETSFTFATDKWNYFVNYDWIWLNWEFYKSIEDSPLYLFEGEYLATPKGVFQFYEGAKLNDDGEYQRQVHTIRVDGLDPKSFKVRHSNLVSDKDHVYNDGELVEWLDWASFEMLTGRYFKNLWKIYKWSPSVRTNSVGVVVKWYELHNTADFATFESLWYKYSKDKNGVYYETTESYLDEVEYATLDADIATFETIEPDFIRWSWSWGYAKDKDWVYFWSWVISTDVEWFHSYTRQTGKDSETVFCSGEVLDGADIATFRPVISPYDDKYIRYFVDKNALYQANKSCTKVGDIDWSTYEYLNGKYMKDAKSVYYGKELIEADSATFEILSNWGTSERYSEYARDVNSVYFKWKIVDDFDAQSFNIIGSDYFSDKNGVYFGSIILRQKEWIEVSVEKVVWADVGSFSIHTGKVSRWLSYWPGKPGYAIDKNNVYTNGKKIEGLTPETFNPAKPGVTLPAENEECQYELWSGRINAPGESLACCPVEANEWEFVKLNNFLAMTDSHIYGWWSYGSQMTCRRLTQSTNGLEIIESEMEILKDIAVSYYVRNQDWVYYSQTTTELCDMIDVQWTSTTFCWLPLWLYEIQWADLATFVNINGEYTKDKNYVYYQWVRIPWADSATFVANLKSEVESQAIHQYTMAKDKNFVYSDGKVFEWASPDWFRYFRSLYIDNVSWLYYFDRGSVQKITIVDPATFRYDEKTGTFMDKNWVYLWRWTNSWLEKIEWADPETLVRTPCNDEESYICRYSNWWNLKDKNNVYKGSSVLIWADPATFKLSSTDTYAQDKHSVYYNSEPIDIDVNNFVERRDNSTGNSSRNYISDWTKYLEGNRIMTDFDIYHLYSADLERNWFRIQSYQEYLELTDFDFDTIQWLSDDEIKQVLINWFNISSTKEALKDALETSLLGNYDGGDSDEVVQTYVTSIIERLQKPLQTYTWLKESWYDLSLLERTQEEVAKELYDAFNTAFDDLKQCDDKLMDSIKEDHNKRYSKYPSLLWQINEYNDLLWSWRYSAYSSNSLSASIVDCDASSNFSPHLRWSYALEQVDDRATSITYNWDIVDAHIKELHVFVDDVFIAKGNYSDGSLTLMYEDILHFDQYSKVINEQNRYSSYLYIRAYTENNGYYELPYRTGWGGLASSAKRNTK